MHRSPFTVEIHPRAWYALANLPKEAYERIQAGLAAVADNAAHAAGDGAGGFLSLDGFLARYEVHAQRRCVTVLDVERVGHAVALPAPGLAPARNVLDVPEAREARGAREDAPRARAADAAHDAAVPALRATQEQGDC